ncbi:MAG: SIMPL domain-containing protein [Anaerolineae bacterium]|nr:SIMPL domain-containing protein [Anaerolineae bacterium]
MNPFKKFFAVAALVLTMGALATTGASAQAVTPDTITVSGSATVTTSPTQANIELGVEIFGASVREAFAQSNETIRAINDALIALGVAAEDIQTSNLSVFSNTRYNNETGSEQTGYQVNNTVRVLIRDVAQASAVIDAAIEAGATAMYGLNFSATDTAALETQARAEAFAQAQARAAELAALSGATLGNVVSISEGTSSAPIFFDAARSGLGGGGAFVAPGQSDVNVSLQVTFAIVR